MRMASSFYQQYQKLEDNEEGVRLLREEYFSAEFCIIFDMQG